MGSWKSYAVNQINWYLRKGSGWGLNKTFMDLEKSQARIDLDIAGDALMNPQMGLQRVGRADANNRG